jgi:activator of HSP90 ATPase
MATPAITQVVEFPVSSERLFDAYLDPIEHARITGSLASISSAVGVTFSAFNGMISGKNLLIVPKQMIVQSWRAGIWNESDLDSVLVLVFEPAAAGGRITLTHVNVPEHDHRGVTEGWEKYYWTPRRAYLGVR